MKSIWSVGPLEPQSLSFEAEKLSIEQVRSNIKQYSPSCLLIHQDSVKQDINLLWEIKRLSPSTQILLFIQGHNPELTRNLVNTGCIFRVLSNNKECKIDESLQEALQEFGLIQQNQALQKVSDELSSQLTDLQATLKNRISERQSGLEDKRHKIEATTRQTRLLLKGLLALHSAQTLLQIESGLLEALKEELGLKALRISYRTDADLPSASPSALSFQIKSGGQTIGLLQVETNQPAACREFFRSFVSAVGLAIIRLARLEELETLKTQWESTFDSLEEPFALLSSDREIVRHNKAYEILSGQKDIIGRRCYEALFGRETACDGCHFGKTFDLNLAQTRSGEMKSFRVGSSSIGVWPESFYVMSYSDVTKRKHLESRLIESAKLAELGTIGGSLAHELNNPVAGMLTFIQLIKSDLAGDETFYEDILEIEKGILRSRNIIHDLLGFTRRDGNLEAETFDLRQAVKMALQIVELKTKPIGIEVLVTPAPNEMPNQEVWVNAPPTVVIQALVHLLNDAIEATQKKKKIHANGRQQINVNIMESASEATVEVLDGGSAETRTGLGLTLAFQLIEQHGGRLEVLRNTHSDAHVPFLNQAKISFSRPVF